MYIYKAPVIGRHSGPVSVVSHNCLQGLAVAKDPDYYKCTYTINKSYGSDDRVTIPSTRNCS